MIFILKEATVIFQKGESIMKIYVTEKYEVGLDLIDSSLIR